MDFKFKLWDLEKLEFVESSEMILEKITNYDISLGIRKQDINGKEIYEGDIVSGNMTYMPDVKLTGLVKYSPETLNYVLKFYPNANNPFVKQESNPDQVKCQIEDLSLISNLEVIGNIFENAFLAESLRIN